MRLLPLVAAMVLLAATADVGVLEQSRPQGMRCGGNQLIREGAIQAARVKGIVEDGAGAVFPNAWIQIQVKEQTEVLLNMQVDG